MRSLLDLAIRFLSGLRFRLSVLVLLTCAPLVVLMLHNAGEGRRRALANWQKRPDRLVESLRKSEAERIGKARQFLLATSLSAPVRSLAPLDCRSSLKDLASNYPEYSNVGLLTTNGALVASIRPLSGKPDDVGQPFLKRVLETGAFVIGDYYTDGPKARPVVTFGYPVLGDSGQVMAVLFAELDLHYFPQPNSDLVEQLPRLSTFTEFDHKGTILARSLKGAKGGNPPSYALPPQPLLFPWPAHTPGVLEGPDEAGVPTVFAFTSVPSQLTSHPISVVLGVPQRVLFQDTDRLLRQNLSWLGIAAAIALILGWIASHFLILRPVKTLVSASARLGAGDLSVRTGLRHGRHELGQLVLAFDQMAQSLQEREQERLRASQKLQVLSQRLVEVQESERRHIARELHDEIGQTLTAAEMNLQAALQTPGAAALERRLAQSIEAVERVLEQVHDLSLNLRPSMLDDLGLEAALRWYTHRQADLTGLKAEFHPVPLSDRLPGVVETGCFRVAQEALTNVVRHAQAHSVAVQLSTTGNHLHLVVRDDGVGFDVHALRARAMRGASLGLLSMEERTVLAGGGFELKSKPGKGTEVHAWFPLDGRGDTEFLKMHEHTR